MYACAYIVRRMCAKYMRTTYTCQAPGFTAIMRAMTNDHRRPKAGLIWERLAESARDPQPALSREQIVRAAIAIADADGVQALTMRRLATDLGTAAMSLYRHVFNKEDLLDLMLDRAFGEIALPAHSGDWRTDLRIF